MSRSFSPSLAYSTCNGVRVHTYLCMIEHIHVCACVYVCVGEHVCVHVHMYVLYMHVLYKGTQNVHDCTQTCVRMRFCMCMYTCVCACTHVHIVCACVIQMYTQNVNPEVMASKHA